MSSSPRVFRLPMLFAVLFLLAACAAHPPVASPDAWRASRPLAARGATADTLQLGLGRVEITPDHPVPLGGYGIYAGAYKNCRWSKGVHDPLYATALYLQKGPDQLVVIALDLLGLVKPDQDDLRAQTARALHLDRERVILTISHTHHGPDTVGLWGTILPAKSGRDEKYLLWMKKKAVEAALQAYQNRAAGTISYALGEEKDLHENVRRAEEPTAPIDDTITLLVLKNAQDEVIGTLTNWACHPTSEDAPNRLISADWVYYFRQTMAKNVGGIPMFVNGDFGGSVQPSPKWRDSQGITNGGQGFVWAEAMGGALGRKVAALVPQAKPLPFDRIEVRYSPVRVQNRNLVYRIGRSLGIFKMAVPDLGDWYETQVTAVKMGPLRWGTMPGEMMADLGGQIRQSLGGDAQILVALGQDWLGYIVNAERYDDPRYAYEKMLCFSPQLGPTVVQAYRTVRFE
ncbi:MAG: hypothetical protein GX444_13610 [Myxococcales bacterium]|nr:hypothetical protein [Myxococcales bacterium]